jgi:hypothetical protein
MHSVPKTVVPARVAGSVAGVLLAATWLASLGHIQPGASALAGDDPTPVPKPPDQLSSEIQTEADFPEVADEEKNRPFFDHFAWKDFIALNWPADETLRGRPHPTKKFGDTSVPTVWGSWKSVGELFPHDPVKNPPTPWDSFEAVLAVRRVGKDRKSELVPLKGLAADAGKHKVLTQVSKLEDINQAGTPDPEFPLVAQNKTFVRYEIRVNRLQYDFARDHKLYLRKTLDDLQAPLEFPDQSISVKAAWRELPPDKQVRDRFYNVSAKVVDWKEDGTPVLQDRVMGLVGLHIVHRTPKRKNWIWTTFEHVDNTELGPGGISPPSFNSKDEGMAWGTPGTNSPPPNIPVGKPIPNDAKPVEVARKTDVAATTKEVNKAYQNHPQIKETVWRNYRLVATQWPQPPGDGPAEKRFPLQNVANVTMETYHQPIACMTCHAAASAVKFVFYPELRAVDPNAGPANAAPPAVEKVRQLLRKEADKPPRK